MPLIATSQLVAGTLPNSINSAAMGFDNVTVSAAQGPATVGQVVGLTATRTPRGTLSVDWQAPADALTATYAVTLLSQDGTVPPINLSAITDTTDVNPAGHVFFTIPANAHIYDLTVSLVAVAGVSQSTIRIIVNSFVPPIVLPPAPTRRLVRYAFPIGRAFVSRNFGLVEAPDGS